jgi:tRNA U34 5-methylaminomethyl-2-thiouridine-forming methyltransferase MnmC
MMPIKLISSADGSSTLYNEELQETYHSQHGAITESRHVFIRNGLEQLTLLSHKISILEIGFGTGLNALLSLQHSLNHSLQIYYHALDIFPLPLETIYTLNYPQYMMEEMRALFYTIHECSWNSKFPIYADFELYKELTSVEDFIPARFFDLIYFDAFAPNKQPSMWVAENFIKLFNCLHPGGILVSYCASGQFKRNLKSAGFIVESLPGPPYKKEMTRGLKAFL